jgi:hypothetical protein
MRGQDQPEPLIIDGLSLIRAFLKIADAATGARSLTCRRSSPCLAGLLRPAEAVSTRDLRGGHRCPACAIRPSDAGGEARDLKIRDEGLVPAAHPPRRRLIGSSCNPWVRLCR